MKPVGSRLCQIAESEGDTNLTTRRAEWQARRIEPTTKALLARDEAAFLHQSVSTPCLNAAAKAEGIWIEDLSGRRYMDFHGNNVHHIGYGHPRLKAAIAAQMDALPFAPRRYACESAVLLAEKLARIAPGDLSKVLFTTGGSDAIEVAVKVARAATGRFKTLSFWDAFHGAGAGAAALSGEMLFRSGPAAPLVVGALHIAPFGLRQHYRLRPLARFRCRGAGCRADSRGSLRGSAGVLGRGAGDLRPSRNAIDF